MITEKKITTAFKKHTNMLILYLFIAEMIFYAHRWYFKNKLGLETEIFTYFVFHVAITVAFLSDFIRKILIEVLVTE